MKLDAGLLAFPMLVATFGFAGTATAHCDALDGPVVSAARRALDTGNIALVLVWVNQANEDEIRRVFVRARNVRRAGGETRELADTYFFETLVRVHRAGEGAEFTGLKPAGLIEPAVATADKAIETGKLQPLSTLIAERIEKGLHSHFSTVVASKKYDSNDVEAGRAYSKAYVEFVHYAERLYAAGETLSPGHANEAATARRH